MFHARAFYRRAKQVGEKGIDGVFIIIIRPENVFYLLNKKVLSLRPGPCPLFNSAIGTTLALEMLGGSLKKRSVHFANYLHLGVVTLIVDVAVAIFPFVNRVCFFDELFCCSPL